MTGEAEPCRSICQGVGWPSPADATPALASKIPKISAVALNRDNTGIDLPQSWPVLAVPAPRGHDICVSNTCLSCNDTFRLYGATVRFVGLGAAIRQVCLYFWPSPSVGSQVATPGADLSDFPCHLGAVLPSGALGGRNIVGLMLAQVAASAGVQHSAAKSPEHLAGNGDHGHLEGDAAAMLVTLAPILISFYQRLITAFTVAPAAA
jgi:hypothetical protein